MSRMLLILPFNLCMYLLEQFLFEDLNPCAIVDSLESIRRTAMLPFLSFLDCD